MLESLKPILELQELDIKMIRLMRMKKQRKKELAEIESLRQELRNQLEIKQAEIEELNKEVNGFEETIASLTEKLKGLEEKQSTIRKVDEFNALTQEMTTIEREKIANEQQASNLIDKKSAEEEILEKIKDNLKESEENSKELENEIKAGIDRINEEGVTLREKRNEIAQKTDEHLLAIYERLLRNKKDRVIVPIENRTCSGCHIALTIQHENLVRKGDNLVFCEHCSRIHYWQESQAVEGTAAATRRRRRRATVASS